MSTKRISHITASLIILSIFSFSFFVRTQIPHTFAAGTAGNANQGTAIGTAGNSNQSTENGTAGNANCDPSTTLCNPINVPTLSDFVAAILNIVLTIGIPIITIFLIYSGFLFVAARGNAEKLETAKQNFIWVVIGAALLLGAWIIAHVIAATVEALQQ